MKNNYIKHMEEINKTLDFQSQMLDYTSKMVDKLNSLINNVSSHQFNNLMAGIIAIHKENMAMTKLISDLVATPEQKEKVREWITSTNKTFENTIEQTLKGEDL